MTHVCTRAFNGSSQSPRTLGVSRTLQIRNLCAVSLVEFRHQTRTWKKTHWCLACLSWRSTVEYRMMKLKEIKKKIRWCPAHKGIPGDEVADGWAKQAASGPDDRGVEWLTLAKGGRLPSWPTSRAHLKRRASEKKWPEARQWCERRRLNMGYVLWEKGKPDPTPARAEKRTASRF